MGEFLSEKQHTIFNGILGYLSRVTVSLYNVTLIHRCLIFIKMKSFLRKEDLILRLVVNLVLVREQNRYQGLNFVFDMNGLWSGEILIIRKVTKILKPTIRILHSCQCSFFAIKQHRNCLRVHVACGVSNKKQQRNILEVNV